MEIILKILTLIMLIGIFYNIRQHKKHDEWNERENQAIYDLGQVLVVKENKLSLSSINWDVMRYPLMW